MAHMTKEKMEQLTVPLPPLAEQHRIVAKVDELMGLLDQIEARQTAREATRRQLTTASLARLSTSDTSPDDFRDHARFLLDHLPAHTNSPEQVRQLRRKIIELAVIGALSSEVSERTADRASTITLDSMTLKVPPEWKVGTLSDAISDGPQNGISPKKSDVKSGPKSLTLTATTSGKLDVSFHKHIELSTQDAEKYWLQPGDLLFQRGNTREYVGMAAIYDGPEKEFVFPDLMIRVRLKPGINLRFMHLWCISPAAREYFSRNASGAQETMPKINQRILLDLPIPLPTLKEQEIIVAKVDELMTLCDHLDAALDRAETSRTRLLDAELHAALDNREPSELAA